LNEKSPFHDFNATPVGRNNYQVALTAMENQGNTLNNIENQNS